ncbi:RNA-binding protein 44 isoform X2 [Nerophis lumbriciformis]|uniref:RNA-binding protein 44 isoform X2 n=1 Tax=Nerophis lumbriciformis TaxID=546530 RepID=UPI002AE08EC8|nr:RNA-binding protein 44 isoform X2 [Nerophis lumbriciformis]
MAFYAPCWSSTLPYWSTPARPLDQSSLLSCYHTQLMTPQPTIKFFLQRSLYNFVAAHPNISLIDDRLADWYLSLSSNCKQAIQDEGGFHQFVWRHPALEVLQHHVCLKNDIEGGRQAAKPNITHNQLRYGRPGERETFVLRENPKLQQPHQDSTFPSQEGFQVARPSCPGQFNPCVETLASDPVGPLARLRLDFEQMDRGHQRAHQCSQKSATDDRAEWPPVGIQLQTEIYKLTGDEVKYSEGLSPQPEQDHTLMSVKGSKEPSAAGENPLEVPDVNDDTAVPSIEKQGGIMKDDDTIICVFKDQKTQTSEASLGPPEAPVATSAVATSAVDPELMKLSTANKWTSTLPCVASCGIMVGPPLSDRSSAFTQTEGQATADKNVITEVHMSDLDYIAQQFSQLQAAQEVRQQTDKSQDYRACEQCNCVQRARRAELSVLALQYHMCRMQCWAVRLQENTNQMDTELPASIVAALQKLDCDYNQMREKILAGVHLERLKPLSAGCDRTTCIPIDHFLKAVSQWSSEVMQKAKRPDEDSCRQGASRRTSVVHQIQKVCAKSRSPVTIVSKDNGEAWYDAEEDLHPSSAPELSKDPGLVKEGMRTSEVGDLNLTQTSSMVSSTPTPGGTFVPQRYGTMNAFDTLMAELTRFHPDVGRQRIVGALKELWDTYQGALCPLPLNIIRQMASDLLSRPTGGKMHSQCWQ